MKKRKCEYYGCNRKATRVIRLNDGTPLVYLCKKHYDEVVKDLWNQLRKFKKKYTTAY